MKKIIYNSLRKYAMQILTGHLGRVEETDDKLICYVKAYKCKKNKFTFTIPCKGIRDNTKELARTYDLDKPICYVIEGIKVKDKRVYIFGYDDAEIIIRDCAFAYDLYGHINGKCTLENTFIRSFSSLTFGAKELTLKDMCIKNHLHYSNSLNIYIGADEKLEIINSIIGKIKESTKVHLVAGKEINLQKAKIAGDSIECSAEKITSDKFSSLNSTNEVEFRTEDFDKIKISSPEIKYNDKTIDNKEKEIVFEKIKDPLKLKRAELINALRKIKEQCEEDHIQKENEYKRLLKQQPIGRRTN